MEPRASHVLIGSFLIVTAAAVFGFVIWLAKIEIDREFAYYDIYFEESVSGLSTGGDVRFSGIQVGNVQQIALDPKNPGRLRVRIEVGGDTPIRVGTKATLALQGITGVAFIQLTAGAPKAKKLRARRGQEVPVITSESSAIQKLFTSTPELISKVITIADALTVFLGPENQRRFSSIIDNSEGLVRRLNARGPEIEGLIEDMRGATQELQRTLKQINVLTGRFEGLSENLDLTLIAARRTVKSADKVVQAAARSLDSANKVIDGDIRALVDRFVVVSKNVDKTLDDACATIGHADRLIEKDIRTLVNSAQTAIDRLDSMAKAVQDLASDNEEPLKLFTSDGLVEFIRFIEEARNLVQIATRLLEDIGSDPAQLIFGTERGGVKPE